MECMQHVCRKNSDTHFTFFLSFFSRSCWKKNSFFTVLLLLLRCKRESWINTREQNDYYYYTIQPNTNKNVIHIYPFNYSAGGSTFISEPYYREYFAGGDGGSQGYAPSRSIYGDTAEGPSQSTYEGRYANHTKTAAVYTKTVTAAGLTVDLPSPDSGIGADAITPRDQNNIQQVNWRKTKKKKS